MKKRAPAVAGRFYPGDPGELRDCVDALLASSGELSQPGLRAVLVPHAGYPYSGPTAGHAYARMKGRAVARVFLLGRSHRHRFEGLSLPSADCFETPMGELPVDQAAITALQGALGSTCQEAHELEHTLEVQLPFLQAALGNISIVPILFGSDATPWHEEAGRVIAGLMQAEDLLVLSTDLSHYLRESEANAIDRASLDFVLTQSPQAVREATASGACSMCGTPAVVAGMSAALALGAQDWSLLDYRTSGAVSHDFNRVVGYGALSMSHAA
ncbi:MAG: AmmeMemoRadiSam system protein B [Candidatus Hydrogenedentes bacterium]|nr:AmmeMemoRadiSam system protein B [Candidatus Hydrogenedentota bacterium]